MRKEISPELFNYNKYPGPEFRLVGNQVLTEQLTFELVENQNEAFDATVFGQRFSEVLTKFDYIVGDWSNEQLRLRGFYKDDRPVTDAEKISRLEDYLLEYCSYGCAYFVLENAEPRRASFDKKSSPKQQEEGNRSTKRGGRQNRRNRSKNQQREREQEQKQKTSQPKKKNRQRSRKKRCTGWARTPLCHPSKVKREKR
mgnify:CR=1 FL=1